MFSFCLWGQPKTAERMYAVCKTRFAREQFGVFCLFEVLPVWGGGEPLIADPLVCAGFSVFRFLLWPLSGNPDCDGSGPSRIRAPGAPCGRQIIYLVARFGFWRDQLPVGLGRSGMREQDGGVLSFICNTYPELAIRARHLLEQRRRNHIGRFCVRRGFPEEALLFFFFFFFLWCSVRTYPSRSLRESSRDEFNTVGLTWFFFSVYIG